MNLSFKKKLGSFVDHARLNYCPPTVLKACDWSASQPLHRPLWEKCKCIRRSSNADPRRNERFCEKNTQKQKVVYAIGIRRFTTESGGGNNMNAVQSKARGWSDTIFSILVVHRTISLLSGRFVCVERKRNGKTVLNSN